MVEQKEVYSQSKKDFYDETKNDYDEKYLDPIPTTKAEIKISPSDLGENEVAVNLPDFQETFHNPDLSKLPKEIPIPGHGNYVHESAEEIREMVAAQEIPLLEQQPTEETQHRRQLALRNVSNFIYINLAIKFLPIYAISKSCSVKSDTMIYYSIKKKTW